MLISKQKYYFFLLVFLLLPFSLRAAWSEPTQVPPGGNVAVPVYSTGLGQTIDGTLHVGTPGSYETGLQGTGSTSGIQGNSPGNALYGNATANGVGAGRGVFGAAVDADDYALYSSGGYGLGFASGDIRFLQQDAGIAWPRESDGVSLYGVYVNDAGELQVRGHGGGINFMDQTTASRLTISEAGATNVVNGPLTVGGTAVCLQNGAGCPPPPAPPPPPVGATLWTGSGGGIWPVNSSDWVGVNTTLQFQSELSAQSTIDFDPLNASKPGGNYFILQSGISPSYAQRQQMRVNRDGETLLGSDLFIGNNNAQGVANMTPYNNPTANAAWGIRGKGGASIEAVPGGGVGSAGDINLKSGTLKLQWLNSDAGDVKVNDTLDVQYGIKNSIGNLDITDDLKVTGGAGFGGYDPEALIKVTTPSLFSEQILTWTVGQGGGTFKGAGTINAQQLCIQGDCKADWAAVATSGSGWTRVNPNTYLTNITDKVGMGVIAPASKLQINPENNVEGLRVISSNYSPFVVATAVGADLARINQNGDLSVSRNLIVSGINNRIGGATRTVPLAVKTNASGGGITVECSLGGCDNDLEMYSNNLNYAVVSATWAGGGRDLILQPNWPGINGGKVGIGTTAPNSQLHIKTATGNSEFDIQSVASPYWAMYQDDGTNQLRFWNNDVAAPLTEKNVLTLDDNGFVGIGTVSPGTMLDVKPVGNTEGIRVTAGAWSPLVIKNTSNADLFRVDQGGNTTVYGSLKIGSTASNPYLVTETFANKTALGIKDPAGVPMVYFGSDTGIGGGNGVTITSNLYFTDSGANPRGYIINEASGAKAILAKYCFGANCKTTDWGPKTTAYPQVGETNPYNAIPNTREYITLPANFDGLDYFCSPGFVVIGYRNSSPGKLICGKMW